MRKIFLLILLFPLITLASELSDSNKLFDFAESEFPEFFAPAGSETFELNEYLVRYYADSDTYIGTQSSDVYVYGDAFNGLLKLGKISDYIELELEGDALFAELFAAQKSDVQLEGQGVVVALLSDDLQGDRHQRFIVKLNSGQTLLLAHNIDLAPRLNTLSVGDWVEFFGEYEWNDKGGVIHWTHYDPAGWHIDGWILHHGVMYQSL
ncbi:MAG: DUF3465 domain-containing protein [Methyloprofundus sp.]|nr:DUF3465 domain-containing protein [Methyloprofundus sp.]